MNESSRQSESEIERLSLRQRWLLFALFVAIAVFLSAAVLVRLPGQIVDHLALDRWTAIAPFGRVEVVFVHVVSGLVIAFAIGRIAKSVLGESRGPLVFAVLVGGIVAVMTLYLAPVDGRFGASPFWLRVVWTLALQLPWCVAAMIVSPKKSKPGADWVWAVFVAAAVLLPMAHGQFAAKRESQAVAQFASTGRFMKAWRHAVALESMAGVQSDVGAAPPAQFMSTHVQGGRPSDLMRSDLVSGIIAQSAAVSHPLSPTAGVAESIQRASALLSLDRLDEAARLLENGNERRPDVLLVLAGVYEEQREPGQVVEVLEEAAAAIGDAKGASVEAATRDIYQRLAQNLRLQQRYGDAEACLLKAIKRYGHSHGFFYFELGLHCQLGGRFRKSLEYYRQCVAADERYKRRVGNAVRELRLNTPACILRPVEMVTR